MIEIDEMDLSTRRSKVWSDNDTHPHNRRHIGDMSSAGSHGLMFWPLQCPLTADHLREIADRMEK